MSFYEVNDKDADVIVRYAAIFMPAKHIDREKAREILEYMKSGYHQINLTDPAALDGLLKDFEASKPK